MQSITYQNCLDNLCETLEEIIDIETSNPCEPQPKTLLPYTHSIDHYSNNSSCPECLDFQKKWTIRKTKGKITDWWNKETLEIDILRAGDNSTYPKLGDQVTINYVIKSIDGIGIDWSRKPFKFRVGSPKVMKGLNKAIRRLSLGVKAKLYLPAHLAYGWNPPNQQVKPFSEIIMTIDIISIKKNLNPVHLGCL